MGHSTTTLCLACNAALTLASVLLFGNETTSSISHGLCAGEFSLIGPRPIKVERRDGEDRLIWKDAGKNGYGGPQNCPCWKEKGCFGRRTMKGRDIYYSELFFSEHQTYSNIQKWRWHTSSFPWLFILNLHATTVSVTVVSLCLGILNKEQGRMNFGEWLKRNGIKWNGIRDTNKERDAIPP